MRSALCMYIVRGYCAGHRHCIHPKKSEEVQLNNDDKDSKCDIMFGEESISKVQSTLIFTERTMVDLISCRRYNWVNVYVQSDMC